jgi:ribulose 1,5-bisphosphate synthetase/thiazole synthase
MMDYIKKQYDVVIVGGGLSGLCAAIASARGRASTALIHNRPVLGGNASSEIRMHICGADNHGHRANARETGILEELLLENRKRNPQYSFSVFDTIMWEKARFQEGLDLYLNTHMTEVVIKDNKVEAIIANQLTTEKSFKIKGKVFVDATGDGTLAQLSGASYMVGREGKDIFNEPHAPEKSDHCTMGNTLLFKTTDIGHPVPFERPFWANTYTEEDLQGREHGKTGYNYWWIELGGDELDVVADGEVIRDELLKAVYGVWDHIKNGGEHGAENYALDWVGFLPGKRESRRVLGDYILKEMDLAKNTDFEDAVAYGGWPMDMHAVGGLRTRVEPTVYIQVPDVYQIPYRCLYSKEIENLMIAGRAISTSHMAFGSTRVMGTCAVVGQAVGTAAAMASSKKCLPKEINKDIKQLQLKLLRDDAYIPGVVNDNPHDKAKKASISCSSCEEGYEADNVINGISRTVHDRSNCWMSKPLDGKDQWIELSFPNPVFSESIEIKFDSNLSKQLMISMFKNGLEGQEKGIPKELVKDYDISFYSGDSLVDIIKVKDNYLRFRKHELKDLIFDKVRISINETNGDERARIFEISMY